MDICIYEPIYLAGQTLSSNLRSAFVMPDNSHAAWREFRILVEMYRQEVHRTHDFTALFSPKFALKTGLTDEQVLSFVERHSDKDVSLFNWAPHLPLFTFNVWTYGEIAHPGINAAAENLLRAAKIDLPIRDAPRNDEKSCCYSNFWVGSRSFWEAYVGGVLSPLAEWLDGHADAPEAIAVMQTTYHTEPAPFLPFIAERLFSTFIAHRGIDAVPYDGQCGGTLSPPDSDCAEYIKRHGGSWELRALLLRLCGQVNLYRSAVAENRLVGRTFAPETIAAGERALGLSSYTK